MRTKRALVQSAMLAIQLSIIVFLGWLGFNLPMNNSITGIIITALSTVVSGWLLLSVLQPLTKHSWFVILLFFTICVWGIIIYQPTDINSITGNTFIERVVEPLNKSLSVFFPSRGAFDDISEIQNQLSYHLLHLAAYFFFVLFFFSIFGRRLINSSRRFLILRSNKNIFWDDSQGGRLLAYDILKTSLWKHTVFVFSHNLKDESEKEKALFEKIDAMGGIVLYRDFDTIQRFPQGRSHYFLSDDCDFNLKMALKVAKTAINKRQRMNKYLRSEMPTVDYLFRDITNIDLHILNQSSLTARQFVSENPLIDIVPQEKINGLIVEFDFNILILGFCRFGRQLLNKTICDAQFKGSSFSATIIDKDTDMINGDYKLLFEECITEYNVSFLEIEKTGNIGSKDFYQWLKENHRRFTRIFVTLGDDALNLNTALSLANIMIAAGDINPQNRLFVNIADRDKYVYSEYPITMFGRLDKLYTCDVIVAEKMDRVAKAINYVYCNYRNVNLQKIDWEEAEKLWLTMSNKNSTFSKNSSRALAMCVRNIVKIAGGRDEFNKAIENPEMLEILSESEHMRWNAFHFTEGITRWHEIDDDSKNDAKLFKYPDEKIWLLKHACLVKYNELDRISERVNEIRTRMGTIETKGIEDYKEIDRMIVRHFGLFYDVLDEI